MREFMNNDDAVALTIAAQAGDKKAIAKLTDNFEPMVICIAFHFRGRQHRSLSRQDLKQLARLGVLEGIQSYDSTLHVKVHTHLHSCARWAILNAIRRPAYGPDHHSALHKKNVAEGGANRMGLEPLELEAADSRLHHDCRLDTESMLRVLDRRSADVIRHVYGIGCEKVTYRNCKEKLGITHQRVNQLHAKALHKLRARFGEVTL